MNLKDSVYHYVVNSVTRKSYKPTWTFVSNVTCFAVMDTVYMGVRGTVLRSICNPVYPAILEHIKNYEP